MFKRTAWLFLMGVLAIGFQGVVAGTASAHSLSLVASASCVNNAAVINYTVTSYDQADINGSNPEIDVLFNLSKVDAQPFSLATNPPNQFKGQKPAPAGVSVSVEAVAVDLWSDGFQSGANASLSVPIPANCAPPSTGRFTGGGKQVIVGYLTITKGFEVDCDLRRSDNLEINWQDGAGAHQFHMENFLHAKCTLEGNPTPPVAPVNTIVGIGTGRFDGADGYTVEFTLQDNGEPGRNDQAGFKVCVTNATGNCDTAPAGSVVLAFPANYNGNDLTTLANLTDGNIQAHVDQH